MNKLLFHVDFSKFITSPSKSDHRLMAFLLIVVVVFFSIGYFYSSEVTPTLGIATAERGNNPMDIALYYAASSTIKNGNFSQLYDRDILLSQAEKYVGGEQYIGWYIYPPIFAILMVPITLVPFIAARIIWLFINQIILFAGLLLIARCTRNLNQRLAIIMIFALALMFTPVRLDLQMGNVNILMFFLLALTLYLLIKDRGWLTGVPLGIAIGIKFTPAPLVVYLIMIKKFRAAAAAMVTFILMIAGGIAACGWDTTRVFFSDVLPGVGWLGFGADAPTKYSTINQSIYGFFLRLFTDAPDELTRAVINEWVVALLLISFSTLMLAGASMWVIWNKRNDNNFSIALGFSLFILVSCLVSPISWVEHLVVLLIPALILLDWLVEPDCQLKWEFPISAAAFAVIAANHPYGVDNGWKTFYFSPAMFGMLFLWISMISIINHPARKQQVLRVNP